MYYEVWKANSSVFLIQKNRQYGGTKNLSNFTGVATTTVNTVTYCEYQMNDNICHLEGRVNASDSVEDYLTFQLNLGLDIKKLIMRR